MHPMSRPLVLAVVLLAALLVVPAAVSAQDAAVPAPPAEAVPAPAEAAAKRPQATVKIKIDGLDNGRAKVMTRVPVIGTVAPFRKGLVAHVTYYLNGDKLLRKKAKVRKGKGDFGVFRSGIRIRRGGKYAASAKIRSTKQLKGDETVRKDWKVRYESISSGECGRVVKGFKGALRRLGYVPGGGSCFSSRTGRAMIAYRKVNGMSRNAHAGKALVKRIFSGRGGYRVKHPEAGDHAEVDISRQILVIIEDGDEVAEIYHVSTGAPSTPTVRGHFRFYMKQPGYNNVGMYHSTYFYGGYAVHGYHSVPTYNASHGCVRVPIPDAKHISDQLDYGESIFVSG